jgi:glucose-1-phosphate thymidylyltransferase
MVSGYWKDTGNVADMLEVNRMVLETAQPRCSGTVDAGSEIIGRVVIESDAEVSNSRIVGPVIIGARAKITGSYVGPFTAIGRTAPSTTARSSTRSCCRASVHGVRRMTLHRAFPDMLAVCSFEQTGNVSRNR